MSWGLNLFKIFWLRSAIIYFLLLMPSQVWSQDQDTSIHQATIHGDVEKLQALLADGVDIGLKDGQGNSAIHFASWHGNVQIIELLLNKGGDINAQNKWGETPLNLAVFFNHEKIVSLLIAQGSL